jgi:hypothetical protein
MAENGDDGEPKGIPLNVPFEHNEEVKLLGGRFPMWDVDPNDPEKKKMKKKWYVPEGTEPEPFRRWMRDGPIFINVPYSQNNEAKKLGARWDSLQKQWFIPAGVDEVL